MQPQAYRVQQDHRFVMCSDEDSREGNNMLD